MSFSLRHRFAPSIAVGVLVATGGLVALGAQNDAYADSVTTTCAAATCTVTFPPDGGTWTVPGGVTQVTATIAAGAGGVGYSNDGMGPPTVEGVGGDGGTATATVPVSAGESLVTLIGEEGASGATGGAGGTEGGDPGGGNGDNYGVFVGGGGGGGTFVFDGTDSTVLLAAGGGGGATGEGGEQGGNGGAPTLPATAGTGDAPGGPGDTGGAAGGTGATGGSPTTSPSDPGTGGSGASYCGSSGGGGGYAGGGGGGLSTPSEDLIGSGGGGSGYAAPGVTVTSASATNTGNGYATFTYTLPATSVALAAKPGATTGRVTLTATVTDPSSEENGQTVTFYDAATQIATGLVADGMATATVSLSSGTHALTASYPGVGNASLASTSAVTDYTLPTPKPAPEPAPVSLKIAPSPTRPAKHEAFALTVAATSTSTAPAGTVTFYEGAARLGTARLHKTAGSHSTATFTVKGGIAKATSFRATLAASTTSNAARTTVTVTPASPPRPAGKRITVTAGETIWSIAAANYPGHPVLSAVLAIDSANAATLAGNPDLIRPGEKLWLPTL